MQEETETEMTFDDLVGLMVWSPTQKRIGVVEEVITDEWDAGWHNYKDFIVVNGERILASHIGAVTDTSIFLDVM